MLLQETSWLFDLKGLVRLEYPEFFMHYIETVREYDREIQKWVIYGLKRTDNNEEGYADFKQTCVCNGYMLAYRAGQYTPGSRSAIYLRFASLADYRKATTTGDMTKALRSLGYSGSVSYYPYEATKTLIIPIDEMSRMMMPEGALTEFEKPIDDVIMDFGDEIPALPEIPVVEEDSQLSETILLQELPSLNQY